MFRMCGVRGLNCLEPGKKDEMIIRIGKKGRRLILYLLKSFLSWFRKIFPSKPKKKTKHPQKKRLIGALL